MYLRSEEIPLFKYIEHVVCRTHVHKHTSSSIHVVIIILFNSIVCGALKDEGISTLAKICVANSDL